MMIDLQSIQNGFKKKEFFLEYLPIVSLINNNCVGAEALVRWRTPSGVVQPDNFIPIIENTPFSGALTYWIIDRVAIELGEWLKATDGVHISINVPPEILGRGGLEYAVHKSGLIGVASKLIFEITERGIPDKLGVDALNLARHLNLLVALDDVGEKDCNLVVLSRCRVDIVKIDKSVIDRLKHTKRSKAVEGIAALMGVADFNIIAEGVESAEQVSSLKKAGITLAQGWYFSSSLLADDFKKFYSTHH